MKKATIICFILFLVFGVGAAYPCDKPDCPHGPKDKGKGDIEIINNPVAIGKGGEGGKGGDAEIGDISIKTGGMIVKNPRQLPTVLPAYVPEIHILPGDFFDLTPWMRPFRDIKPLTDDVETVEAVSIGCRKTLFGMERLFGIFPRRRIKLEHLTPLIIELFRETVREKGWDPKNVRYRVLAKQSPDQFSSGGNITTLISAVVGRTGGGANIGVIPTYAQNTGNISAVIEFHLTEPKPLPVLPPVKEQPKPETPKETPQPPTPQPAPPAPPVPAPASPPAAKEPEIKALSSPIYYQFNESRFPDVYRGINNGQTAKEIAAEIEAKWPEVQKNGQYFLFLGGCDIRGPQGYNDTLSIERAQSFMKAVLALLPAHIDRQKVLMRVRFAGMGKRQPQSKEHWRNRVAAVYIASAMTDLDKIEVLPIPGLDPGEPAK